MEAKRAPAINTRSLHLRSTPDAVRAARQAFTDLELDLDPGLLFDVSLCVSELVTTSIGEDVGDGEETLELELSVLEGTLSAAVRTRRIVETMERVNGTSMEDDLGLYIISRLADRFGLDRVNSRLWLEFDIADGTRARSPAFEAQGLQLGRRQPRGRAPVAADIRVVLIDDHDLFRGGLRDLLAEHGGVEVVAEAADGAEGIEMVEQHKPEVVVMDLNLPRMSGVEATERLTGSPAGARVLVLTVSADDRTVIDAIKAGASGYMLKDAPVEDIYGAIQAVASGQLLVSPRVSKALVGVLGDAADRSKLAAVIESTLSKRELEVLRLLAIGRENAEIADELVLSPATVKNHVAELLKKLGVDNRIEAAVYAVRAELA